jgi:hypothetical protein
MTQLSQPRRTNLPRTIIPKEELTRRQELRDRLAARCRIIFERVRPGLIEAHHNWYIAIDPDTEQYIIDPTFNGITKKVVNAYGYSNEPKLTTFRLNDTGYCGKI